MIPPILYAKPVSVDEIFTPKKQFKIIGSFSYVNILRKNASLQYIPFEMTPGTGTFINIPSLGYENINQDYLTFSLNARYGIHSRVELFSTVNGFWQKSHTENNGVFSTQSDGDFNSASIGFLIEAKREGKAPAILIGGNGDIVEQTYFSRTQKSLQYGKGYSLFALGFYTVDPIVFFLQAQYRFNLPKSFQDITVHSGDVFVLSPMIYFAINPYVSLNAGVKYQYHSKDKLNNATVSYVASSVGYVFGMAYEIKSKLILFADVEKFDTHTYSSNAISISLSYRI